MTKKIIMNKNAPIKSASANVAAPLFRTSLLCASLLAASFNLQAHTDAPANSQAAVYEQSIDDAAVIEKDEIINVAAITAEKARFVTWTSYPSSFQGAIEGDGNMTLAWGDTWVTRAGDVQEACKTFDQAELNVQVQQLLGLPPQADAKRYFVELEVKTADMFRPCASPSLSATTCSANFDDDANEAHRAWYAGQSAVAYQAPNGYPWTRLGYTYDWNPKTDEVGVFEFVIRKGAAVKAVSIAPTEQYCQ